MSVVPYAKKKREKLSPEERRLRTNELNRVRNQKAREKQRILKVQQEQYEKLKLVAEELKKEVFELKKENRQLKGIPEDPTPPPEPIVLHNPSKEPIDPHFPRDWDNICTLYLVADYLEQVLHWNLEEVNVKNEDTYARSIEMAPTIYTDINHYELGYSHSTMDLVLCFAYLLSIEGLTPHMMIELSPQYADMKLLSPLKVQESRRQDPKTGKIILTIFTTDFHVDKNFIYFNGGTKLAVKLLYQDFFQVSNQPMETYSNKIHQWFWRLCKKQ